MPSGSTLHIPPTNYDLLAAEHDPYKKKPTSQRNVLKNFLEKNIQENGPVGRKKDKTERAMGVVRRTIQESKVESNESPEIPEGGKDQTSPASLRGVKQKQTTTTVGLSKKKANKYPA